MALPPKSCGPCHACCQYLTLELHGSLKPASVLCPHAKPPHGCGIYETRPQLCRDWFCGWRRLPSLGDEWRPDQCEVLITFRFGPAPDGKMDGIEFILTESHERITWMPLIRYIGTLIADGKPVYLSLPGEPGYQSPWVYLSNIPELQDAVARRDLAVFAATLKGALQICIDMPKVALPG